MRSELFRGVDRDERLAETADSWHLALLKERVRGSSGLVPDLRQHHNRSIIGTWHRSGANIRAGHASCAGKPFLGV